MARQLDKSKPKQYYNPTTRTYSIEKKDGYYPLIMWVDGGLSELLYHTSEPSFYYSLKCYRFNEDSSMSLSKTVLRYVTKEIYERYIKRFAY